MKNRQQYRRANIISLIVCAVSLFVIGMLVRKIILDDREQALYTFSDGAQTQDGDSVNAAGSDSASGDAANAEGSDPTANGAADAGTQNSSDGDIRDTAAGNTNGEASGTAQTDSQALPDYYEKRYLVGTPVMYTTSEIETKLAAWAQTDADFRTIYNQRSMYPESLLNALCNNRNMIDFALGYSDNYDKTSGSLEESELEADVPLFIQWDPRWGYAAYGNDVVGLCGCGPTCLSMVVVGLTKNQYATPAALADYATEHDYYESGAGTKWSFMEEAGAYYGVRASWMSVNKDRMIEELDAGHPIICVMDVGDFTAQGHFIVIVGTEDGKFRVNDPNSIERSQKLWDYETLASQISCLWTFELAD